MERRRMAVEIISWSISTKEWDWALWQDDVFHFAAFWNILFLAVPTRSWWFVRCCLVLTPFNSSNSFSSLASSGAIRKTVSRVASFCVIPVIPPITFIVQFSCEIPWSGPIEQIGILLFVTQKSPSSNACHVSGSELFNRHISAQYRGLSLA